MKYQTINDVVAWGLCLGCGACACACPDEAIKLFDFPEDGIRPVTGTNGCKYCGDCLKVCPGIETGHPFPNDSPNIIQELKAGFGPVLELWEGHASDPEFRFHGSSGGIISALALYCLEREGMHAVLHTGPDKDIPWKNKTVLSRTREDLLCRTGSRYSPASPCDGLKAVEEAPRPCVFIGKPCDVVGTRKSEIARPSLSEKIGITIAFFCAGTPASQGILDMIRNIDLPLEEVDTIRFRGKGWPGMLTVSRKNDPNPPKSVSYTESWGFLQKYRPYRCHLCPDGTGEFADIACGDPWYRGNSGEGPGSSLVLVRTEKGRRILQGAFHAGFVNLRPVEPEVLPASQKNLLEKRRWIWGRLLAFRFFGAPIPAFGGFPLFSNWIAIPMKEKLRSTLGTARRIIQRGYYRKRALYRPADHLS